jgi:hypothetical protein
MIETTTGPNAQRILSSRVGWLIDEYNAQLSGGGNFLEASRTAGVTDPEQIAAAILANMPVCRNCDALLERGRRGWQHEHSPFSRFCNPTTRAVTAEPV